MIGVSEGFGHSLHAPFGSDDHYVTPPPTPKQDNKRMTKLTCTYVALDDVECDDAVTRAVQFDPFNTTEHVMGRSKWNVSKKLRHREEGAQCWGWTAV